MAQRQPTHKLNTNPAQHITRHNRHPDPHLDTRGRWLGAATRDGREAGVPRRPRPVAGRVRLTPFGRMPTSGRPRPVASPLAWIVSVLCPVPGRGVVGVLVVLLVGGWGGRGELVFVDADRDVAQWAGGVDDVV